MEVGEDVISWFFKKYHPLDSFMKGYFAPIDFYLLTFVSKSLGEFVRRSVIIPDQRYKKALLAEYAYLRGYYKFACWCLDRNFLFRIKEPEKVFFLPPFDSSEAESQITLISRVFPHSPHITSFSSQGNNLPLLQWAFDNKYPLHPRIISDACFHNNIQMIEWACTKGFILDANCASKAALAGNLPLLEWLVSKNCPMNSNVCSSAALNGHLDVLQWAVENNYCKMDVHTTSQAAEGGHLDVLLWAIENGCVFMVKKIREIAIKEGHEHILLWLEQADG
jgi:hypothetical protein